MFTHLWQDLRFAGRTLTKQPGFTAATLLTLALGIGGTTAIFSVVYGVLLKPLPFREPEQLVSVLHRLAVRNFEVWNHGPATYFTYLDNQRAFEGVGAWESNEVSVTGHGDPERLTVLSVSAATLPLLRVQALRGRLFSEEDDAPGRPARAILTYNYWQRRFGGESGVIGQAITIDGAAVEIIGVLPPSFMFLNQHPAMLLPMQLDRADANHIEFDFQLLARLKPRVTLAQASADMARMIPLLPPVFEKLQMVPYVRPLAAEVIGDVGRILWILLAAVGVVLLIACGNVTNLFLIRAEGRQQELAVRAALGASAGSLARVLLSESLLLALGGGTLGLMLAQATIVLLRWMAPAQLPRIDEIGIDIRVLLFTLLISLMSGALFGLFAVWKFGRPNTLTLREGGRSASVSVGRQRTRHAVVVSQIALALMLLVVSGLMIRTFVALRRVQPGFVGPERVQTFSIAIPEGLISNREQTARTHESISLRLSRVPGVVSVGMASSITMDGENNGNPVEVEDFPSAEGVLPPLWRFKSFAPGYFETMGIHLVAGRSITWSEAYAQRPVVVVSEVLARHYWNDASRALGRRIRTGGREPWKEIVGVTAAERDDGLNHPATGIVYWPILNEDYRWRTMSYVVRSDRVGARGFLRELQQAVWSVNPNLPLSAVQTLDEIEAYSMAQTSFIMVMLATAASVAVALGIVGIYGVIAYVATRRTREIGIRIAFGAQVGDVRMMFLRRGLWLTMSGVALGIAGALVCTRVLSSLLFGVALADPLTYCAGSVALAAVALLATYVPAQRAARIDPIIAIRAEV